MTGSDPSSKFKLVSLCDCEEIQQCHRNNFIVWGNGLTQDQYLQREELFGSSGTAKFGNQTYWALKKLNEQTGEYDEIVSSMETLLRPAYYKSKGKPVVKTHSHSIGSVFTLPHHRNKGYATIMFKLVTDALDGWKANYLTEQERSRTFSALWSDVGNYYEQFDYQLTDNQEIKLDLAQTADLAWPKGVSEISDRQEINKLAKLDEAQLQRIMNKQTEADGVTRVAIIPSAMVHLSTHVRANYYSRQCFKVKDESLKRFGARIDDGLWTLWTHDFVPDKLTLIRIFADESKSHEEVLDGTIKLIEAAIVEANKWKFKQFTLWLQDLPLQLQGNHQEIINHFKTESFKVKLESRPDSWPMIRYYKNQSDNKQWIYDGKFCWY